MRFSPLFVVLSAASALATPFKRDASTVKADIAIIDTEFNTMNDGVSFESGSVPPGDREAGTWAVIEAFDNSTSALGFSLKNATVDTHASDAFSQDDGSSILLSIERTLPVINHAFNEMVKRKEDIKSVGGELIEPGVMLQLMLQDMNDLNNDMSSFISSIAAKVPSSLVDQVNSINGSITSAFDKVITAYSES
ncbi:hypothetical protein PM082_000260 [Marasmius tenuissimus]|nr:hypothetical protein PM082_000260 [Marasmius tenuissimus]